MLERIGSWRTNRITRQQARQESSTGGGTFSSLRYRDYRYLWFGTVFMSAGQWVQQVTLGWLVYDMTNSAVALGALSGVRLLPFLISAPIAGVAADRMDRRKLLLATQLVLFITAFVMGWLVASGRAEVWHVFVFTLITGTAWAFNQPIRQALVPSTVPESELMNAVALSSMGFNITRMIAPTLGGFLIAFFGAGGNFFVQSAAYAGVLAMVYRMHVKSSEARTRDSSAFGDLKEGMRYVASNRAILAIIVTSLVAHIFAVPYLTLMPVFQRDVLGIGPEGLGLLLAAPAVGAVSATFVLAHFADRIRHRGLIRLIALALLGVSMVLFAQANSLALAIVALLGVGCCQMLFMNISMTLLQTIVPDEFRGRVLSIYMLDRGLVPLGALLAGVAAAYVGAPTAVTIMGALVLMLAILSGVLLTANANEIMRI